MSEIIADLKQELREAGIDKPNQVTMLLRHHLGQGLADQGTPSDMIAEMLGHNSTVAARAYVTATPNIARIKEKALGKSPAYQRVMRSLLTGKVVQRRDTVAERAIRGVIDTQYIGDIGACALPVHTHCPYNPVYACYTCKQLIVETMTTFRVVEHLDVIKHITTCTFPCGVDFPLYPFPFQKLEKALGHVIVMTVASTTHAGNQIVRLQKAAPIGAAVLAALDALLNVKWILRLG